MSIWNADRTRGTCALVEEILHLQPLEVCFSWIRFHFLQVVPTFPTAMNLMISLPHFSLSLSLYDDDFFPLKKVTHLSSTSPRNKGWSNFTKLFYSLACLRYRIKDISNSFINTLIILYPIYILDKLFLNIIWVLMYFSVFNYIFRWPLILYRKLGFNTLSGLKFHLNNFVIFVQFFKNKAFEC